MIVFAFAINFLAFEVVAVLIIEFSEMRATFLPIWATTFVIAILSSCPEGKGRD